MYKLKLPPQWRIHPVFHMSLLMPYHENNIHRLNYMRPPPDLIEGEEEYEVESIQNSRFFRHQLQYLVKWKGYPDSDNEWVTASEVHTDDLLDLYHTEHPDAAGPASDTLSKRRGRR